MARLSQKDLELALSIRQGSKRLSDFPEDQRPRISAIMRTVTDLELREVAEAQRLKGRRMPLRPARRGRMRVS